MRTLEEIGGEKNTDKTQSLGYLQNYQQFFGPLRERPIKLLELGVLEGGSLLMWHDYFVNGQIVGLDVSPNPLSSTPDRIRFYQGSQGDTQLLDRIAAECAPDGFDVIIDDAAHIGVLSRTSYQALFNRHLRPGGIYVVEDWGTGYWHNWPDGAEYAADADRENAQGGGWKKIAEKIGAHLGLKPARRHYDADFHPHNFGMVGFVKELVDEVAWRDIAHPVRGTTKLSSRAKPTIRSMTVMHGQVFLEKE